MSRPAGTTTRQSATPARPAPAPAPKTYVTQCAMFLGGLDGPMFGGRGLKIADADINTTLISYKGRPGNDSFMGFTMQFPLGESNEKDGFGVCHSIDPASHGTLPPSQHLKITIKFPRGDMVSVIDPADDGLRALFPEMKRDMSILKVCLRDGSFIDVEGFGLPFANPGHTCEEWLRHPSTAHVLPKWTLLDIIDQRVFTFVVNTPPKALKNEWDEAVLPDLFSYPYGNEHSWNMDRFAQQLFENAGPRFEAARSYSDHNSHLSALTQSQVQDVMCLYKATEDIAQRRFRGYFVEREGSSNNWSHYFILPLPNDSREDYAKPWHRLASYSPLALKLYRGEDDEEYFKPQSWPATIMEHPSFIPELSSNHPLEDIDLVLRVRPDPGARIETFSSRSIANEAFKWSQEKWHSVALSFDPHLSEYQRKVDAVGRFHPDARPSNPVAMGLENGQEPVPEMLKISMSLHRDLMRGQGFYRTMRYGTGVSEGRPGLKMFCSLLEEILPEDRARFRQYFSERPLGLGIIAAGPGYGKTTALAVATLGMRKSIGPVFATGPNNVVVSNFADRLQAFNKRYIDRFNDGQPRSMHARSQLIVRAYKLDNEYAAFKRLVQNPNPSLMEEATTRDAMSRHTTWRLELSVAYWLLVCFGSSAVPQLQPDASPALHAIKEKINGPGLANLRAVVSGDDLTWEEYLFLEENGEDQVKGLLGQIVDAADILCCTPAAAEIDPALRKWKTEVSKAIAVDEAGNMSRPDLCSAWANTLPPCLLAGDERQLAPVLWSAEEHDGQGNARNRLGADGKISPLEFFKMSSLPVYRLLTQFRMARGQFDLCHAAVYKGLPLVYGADTAINAPHNDIGRKLEEYAQKRFPALKRPVDGTLAPLFVHCKNTRCVKGASGSKRNVGQIKIALDFVSDFLTTTETDPSRLIILSPYKAMVEAITNMRRDYPALRRVRPASTVDGIQGQEGDVSVVIMGTTERSGPGFTADDRRLNVMLSRQRSGLVVFGDLDVLGPAQGWMRKVKKGKDGKLQFSAVTLHLDGKQAKLKPVVLMSVLWTLHKAGRIGTVDAKKDGESLGRE